jgi:hypothetical protein
MSLKSWWFPSETNPNKPPYETMLNEDESLSCNCMGWTRRVDRSGRRSCRHTRLVESGAADDYALKVIDYRTGSTQKPVTFRQPKTGDKTTNLSKGRKVAW